MYHEIRSGGLIVCFFIVLVSRPSEQVEYQLSIKTSDVEFASTDANVYITFHGEYAETQQYYLNPYYGFQRAETKTTSIQAPALGIIRRISIHHDGSWFGSDWRLDHVEIKDTSNNGVYLCPWHWWLTTYESAEISCSIKTAPIRSTTPRPTTTVATKQPSSTPRYVVTSQRMVLALTTPTRPITSSTAATTWRLTWNESVIAEQTNSSEHRTDSSPIIWSSIAVVLAVSIVVILILIKRKRANCAVNSSSTGGGTPANVRSNGVEKRSFNVYNNVGDCMVDRESADGDFYMKLNDTPVNIYANYDPNHLYISVDKIHSGIK